MTNDSAIERRDADPAVAGEAAGRIVDACLYEPPLRSELGLLRPTEDPAADGGTQVEGGRLAGVVEAMNRVGVRTTCVVLRQEVEEFLRLRARHPGRLVGWAHYDSLQPERGLEAVRALCEGHADAFAGVATAFVCFGQDPRLKVFAPLYEYCARHGLPVLLRAEGGPQAEMPPRPTAFGVLAAVYPRLRLVCLHDGAIEPAGTAELLARFPNLCRTSRRWSEPSEAARSCSRVGGDYSPSLRPIEGWRSSLACRGGTERTSVGAPPSGCSVRAS